MKQKAKVKNFIIKCDVYPFDVLVCFGGNKQEVKKIIKPLIPGFNEKEFDDDIHFNKYGKALMFNGGQSILWLHHEPRSNEDLSLLSHEIFHIVTFILDRVGIKFSNDSDEVFAYLIQYYTVQIYNKLDVLKRLNIK